MLILRLLPDFLAFLFLGSILLISGESLRRFLRFPVSPGERWAIDFSLGAGITAAWVLPLGLLHLLQTPLLLTGILLQALIPFVSIFRKNRILLPRPGSTLMTALVAALPNRPFRKERSWPIQKICFPPFPLPHNCSACPF